MNQILFYKRKFNLIYNYKFFYSIFFICILLIFIFFFFTIRDYFIYKQNMDFSQSISNATRLKYLYDDKIYNNSSFPIIGQIEIPKLNIKYPIFSYSSKELLKYGICRISGPSPNLNGNLCLAGHNLENNSFFSNLYKLKSNDIIIIYDTNNNFKKYFVYNIFEVKSNNLSILKNNSNINETTLITCNNFNKNRIIVKAKETE